MKGFLGSFLAELQEAEAPSKAVEPSDDAATAAAAPPRATTLTGATTWDQAEADRILSGLRADVARIEREKYRGKFPPVVANVAAVCLACAEAYCKNHEQEAARGWDPMKLVRDAAASTLKTVRGDYLRMAPPASS